MPVGNQGTDPTEEVSDAVEEAFNQFTNTFGHHGMKLGREDGVFYAEFMGEKNKVMRRNILIVAGNKYSTGEVRK